MSQLAKPHRRSQRSFRPAGKAEAKLYQKEAGFLQNVSQHQRTSPVVSSIPSSSSYIGIQRSDENWTPRCPGGDAAVVESVSPAPLDNLAIVSPPSQHRERATLGIRGFRPTFQHMSDQLKVLHVQMPEPAHETQRRAKNSLRPAASAELREQKADKAAGFCHGLRLQLQRQEQLEQMLPHQSQDQRQPLLQGQTSPWRRPQIAIDDPHLQRESKECRRKDRIFKSQNSKRHQLNKFSQHPTLEHNLNVKTAEKHARRKNREQNEQLLCVEQQQKRWNPEKRQLRQSEVQQQRFWDERQRQHSELENLKKMLLLSSETQNQEESIIQFQKYKAKRPDGQQLRNPESYLKRIAILNHDRHEPSQDQMHEEHQSSESQEQGDIKCTKNRNKELPKKFQTQERDNQSPNLQQGKTLERQRSEKCRAESGESPESKQQRNGSRESVRSKKLQKEVHECAGSESQQRNQSRKSAGSELQQLNQSRKSAGSKLQQRNQSRKSAGSKLQQRNQSREFAGSELQQRNECRESAGSELQKQSECHESAESELQKRNECHESAGSELQQRIESRESPMSEQHQCDSQEPEGKMCEYQQCKSPESGRSWHQRNECPKPQIQRTEEHQVPKPRVAEILSPEIPQQCQKQNLEESQLLQNLEQFLILTQKIELRKLEKRRQRQNEKKFKRRAPLDRRPLSQSQQQQQEDLNQQLLVPEHHQQRHRRKHHRQRQSPEQGELYLDCYQTPHNEGRQQLHRQMQLLLQFQQLNEEQNTEDASTIQRHVDKDESYSYSAAVPQLPTPVLRVVIAESDQRPTPIVTRLFPVLARM